MIKTMIFTDTMELIENVPIEKLDEYDTAWYWVDISGSENDYKKLLLNHFGFHHISVDDCFQFYERPKVDFYDDYNFFVLSVLNEKSLLASDLCLFVGENYLVSFHKHDLLELEAVRERLKANPTSLSAGHVYVTYLIFDKIVDQYFPAVYQIEDKLGHIRIRAGGSLSDSVINKVFTIREELLRLRRIINSMKELAYRMINSERLKEFNKNKHYFNDIHNHLLKLSDIIESNRDMTADMRDSYLSINSHRMNKIMTILTIISSIFIPLTFIVGVYGMNFDNMPELKWKYGYFVIWGVMALIGVSMFIWFKVKGWFKIYK